MTWKEAFLRQANSDFSVFHEFQKSGREQCHQAHYLQMASEKLAKAYLCDPAGNPPQTTHNALVPFLRSCMGRPEFRRFFGIADASAWNAYVRSILPLAEHVQKLAPEGKSLNRPNPEYPWHHSQTRQVCSPLDYPFSSLTRPTDPHVGKLLKFIDGLLKSGL